MKICLERTDFNFDDNQKIYKGKVRDVYKLPNKKLIMVVTDRISAFDMILPKPIPFKGQVLNQIAYKFLKQTEDIIKNWVIEVPDPNVSIGLNCEPFKVEMVVRGYLAGHAWREYKIGKRQLCGVSLPEGLKENDKLPFPIITPTTKSDTAHDEDISKENIISSGLVEADDYNKLEALSLKLFKRGTNLAKEKELLLVDTKYEFGKYNDEIILIDEIHTPDSSRYFYSEGYLERQSSGKKQKQLSKEFVREWLISEGFQGKDNQVLPTFSEEKINQISERYIELYEKLTGENFKKSCTINISERILNSIKSSKNIKPLWKQ